MDSITEYQPGLFSLEELTLLNVDRPEVSKRYTAEALIAHRTKRDAVCRALAEGHGLLKIARAFGISHHSVAALRDSRPDLVDIEKRQLSQVYGRVIRLCMERYEDALIADKVHPNFLPVHSAVLSDKKALLDGDPTARVESVIRHEVSLELVAGYLAKKGISMPVIDVASTDLSHNHQQTGPLPTASSTPGCTPPDLPAPVAPSGAEGGGGGAPTGDHVLPTGSRPEILGPKDS